MRNLTNDLIRNIEPGESFTYNEYEARYSEYNQNSAHTAQKQSQEQININIEKLGLDELYIDLTPYIKALERVNKHYRKTSLAPVPVDWTFGIHDDQLTAEICLLRCKGHMGHLLGDEQYAGDLDTASIIAWNIRALIHKELGLTCSAGIGISKLHAKIASSVHKPNDQSILYPQYIDNYLQSMHVRKINGFGFATLKVLYDRLTSESDLYFAEDLGEEAADEGSEFKVQDHAKAELLATEKVPLSVRRVLSKSSQSEFEAWFGQPKGSQLWGLLHGHDTLPVLQSPEYPAQVSIEDSFLGCDTLSDAHNMLHHLCNGLISRMRTDLMDDEGRWAAYPSSLSLTVRVRQEKDRASDTTRMKRESKRSPIPNDVFDLEISDEARSSALLAGVMALLNVLTGGRFADFYCTLFNVSVSGMSTRPPQQSILKWARGTPAAPSAKEIITDALSDKNSNCEEQSVSYNQCFIHSLDENLGFFCLDCRTYIPFEEDSIESHNADSY